MFLRGDIWRAVAINRLQAPTLLSLRDSRRPRTRQRVCGVYFLLSLLVFATYLQGANFRPVLEKEKAMTSSAVMYSCAS